MEIRAFVHWYVTLVVQYLHLLNLLQEAFKSIADKFTPKNWKQACVSNLDGPLIPIDDERAGY